MRNGNIRHALRGRKGLAQDIGADRCGEVDKIGKGQPDMLIIEESCHIGEAAGNGECGPFTTTEPGPSIRMNAQLAHGVVQQDAAFHRLA